MNEKLDGLRPETRLAYQLVANSLEQAEQGPGAGDIVSKGGRDLVTSVDIAIEDAIRERLHGQAIVGEERGGEAPAHDSPYWLLDPICGTRNYASGIPLYCVNLALVENGEVVLAVVGDASRREVSLAERGRGAWTLRNGSLNRLTVSDNSSVIVIEDDGGKAANSPREHAPRCVAAAMQLNRWDIRAMGSSLTLLYLAAGRISANLFFYATAVHNAAGVLLAAEAGAIVSDINGNPWSVNSTSVLASANAPLQEDLLALVRKTAP